ncbi:hypothetical protein HGRIS_006302 [Hohenbuehelia grisea]|uniref:RTA1-like protein n=1 Tax=Hohenbuehelia grisea TaxID=104357 RepID=A0ABR3K2D6_9AGAR
MSDSISYLVARSGSMDPDDSPYGYVPTRSTAIIFVVLFGITALLHTGQAIAHRIWWLLPTVCLGAVVEVLGWSGRLWSSFSPTLSNPFMIQITSTILAPTPFVAANFIILGLIIRRLGPGYSRISPKWYTIIFCSADVISLLVQGAGGGIASSATNEDRATANLGSKIMLAGIIFQMVMITIYSILAFEFFLRYIYGRPVRSVPEPVDDYTGATRGYADNRLVLMSAGLVLSTLCLYVRAIYRTIELADGWTGRIITTEIYFNILDGAMVLIAMYSLNVAHPGRLLRPTPSRHDVEKRVASSEQSLT